jgi:hypothetical protein
VILTGTQIRSMMRRHRKTIRGLAAEWSITMKRVREVRARGVTGFYAEEWTRLITGNWPTA